MTDVEPDDQELLDNRQSKENTQRNNLIEPTKSKLIASNQINGNNSITHDIENLISSPFNDADNVAIEERINNIKVHVILISRMSYAEGKCINGCYVLFYFCFIESKYLTHIASRARQQ